MADLIAHLNTQQRAAVTVPSGHALILAGAGSGKTRVLTTRIAWLVSTGQCPPSGIMAVTFTNKAAREMMTRLSAMLLGANPKAMWDGPDDKLPPTGAPRPKRAMKPAPPSYRLTA